MKAGINIVLRTLEAPIRQIAENSGVEGSIVVGKITDNSSETFGFDAQTEQFVDMRQGGIVDPVKVVRIALQDAASVAGLLITTEAMIADAPKKDSAPSMPGGGMGGMDFQVPSAQSTKRRERPRSNPGPFLFAKCHRKGARHCVPPHPNVTSARVTETSLRPCLHTGHTGEARREAQREGPPG